MNGFALLLATALLGVDYGWQPASDGRLEYIIQLEPVTLIALREGQEVVSQIDPFVRDVRRFRIRVGTDVVPRLGTPVPESEEVTECTGGARGLVDGDLARAYRTQVDPRLNYEQSLELAMRIAAYARSA